MRLSDPTRLEVERPDEPLRPVTGTTLRPGRSLVVGVYAVVFLGALPAFLVVAGLQVDRFVAPDASFPSSVGHLGTALTGLGLLVMLAAGLQLSVKGGGLPISHLPPERLVAGGLYDHVRHAIYSGFLLALAGLGLHLESPGMLLVSLPLLLSGILGYIHWHEEPTLEKRFGDVYRAYRDRTPRLMPSLGVRSFGRYLVRAYARALRPFERLANAPILYRRGPVILVTYGFLCALGLTLTIYATGLYLSANGVANTDVLGYVAGVVLSGLVGARLFWWLRNFRTVADQPWFGLKNTGFVSWGAIAGLVLYSLAFAWLRGLPPLLVTDSLFGALLIGYAVGRLGCLSYGCCWGAPARRFGLRYRHPATKVVRETGRRDVLLHPVQLLSSLHGLIIFLILTAASWLQPALGLVTAASFILYGWGRFLIEFWREEAGTVGTLLTRGHLAAAAMFVSGWLLLFVIPPDAAAGFRPWSLDAVQATLVLLPGVLLLGGVIFITMGLHWKRLGSW